tara:strand:- start:1044 stop:1409 length:366 start_codon:yes stop_codon:yes gene_type:complete
MSVDTALDQTKTILTQRGQDYGDAAKLFEQIAQRFSLVLGSKIDSYTAARLLVELKLSRLDMGWKEDSLLDAIGYLSIAADVRATQEVATAPEAGHTWPTRVGSTSPVGPSDLGAYTANLE